ncbi:MAG: hypothetical protein OEZ65_16965 [Gemmatimonadota bacterium]|nr:hypothetical protein [Gemmatimonadota bacterium]
MLKKVSEAASGLVVIIVGVLVALAADASWAERHDRIREREVLDDLLEEFTENEAILRRDIESNRRARQGGQAWVAAVLGQAAISTDSAYALLSMALGDARFDPATGALRSLVDGGELGLIQNSDLRRALAGWEDRVAEARLTSESSDGQRHALLPFLLNLPADRPLTVAQRTAVLVFNESVAGQDAQIEALTGRIGEIVTMIEGELQR